MKLKTKRMILLFSFILFIPANEVFANLRAPWVINRYPSYSLTHSSSGLVVMKEDLEFNCDEPYEGNGDFSRIKSKKCSVVAIYSIHSKTVLPSSLEFVLPSEKLVSISINHLSQEKVTPILLKISELEKEGYRLSDLCAHCRETINQLYTVKFNVRFLEGMNTIQVKYEQPLAVTEINYGYFQSSKWMNNFSYELWPLREWKLDPKFEMNIQFTTKVGGKMSRLFGQKITEGCRGIDLRFTKVPAIPFNNNLGSNGFDDYYKFNQSLSPNYNLTDFSKSHFESDKLIYKIRLNENFPDRINCFFGHEK